MRWEVAGMEREEIVSRLRERKLLVAPDAVDHLVGEHAGEAEEIIKRIIERASGPFVSRELVEETVSDMHEAQKIKSIVVLQQANYTPAAKDVEADVKIHDEWDVTGKSTCTGHVEDFVNYFRDRLARESHLLKNRPSDLGVTRMSALKQSMQKKNARIVGMVWEKRVTKNGHTLIDIEDEETSLPCFISKDAPAALKEAANDIVSDEVIGFDGYLSNGLFIVKEIIWPDIPIREKKLVEDDIAIAFISDLQIGSRYFMQENFTRFLKFINGDAEKPQDRELAGKIKYLCVAGDVVDGIGIYPEQEKELVTKDVYTQYEIFSEYMKSVPEHIQILIGPGNHDAVRIAQPRPRLPNEFTKAFEGYSNIHLVGDPAFFELHGLRTMMFHGDGFFSLAANMPKLSGAYTNPERAAVEMLKKRHLSPIYGENPVVPEKTDFLFLREVPDLVHFGHVHHNGYATYRGTTVINSGTWQSTTAYQLKQGHLPTPGQLPIYSARTGTLNILDFGGD
jgi:DNA polymerase II small subunit